MLIGSTSIKDIFKIFHATLLNYWRLEYTDESEEEVEGERNPADGESPHEDPLDDDEDAKNPAFIPRYVDSNL